MGQTYRKSEQYLDQLSPGQWIEIGTSRNGDDGSTKTISEWASRYGRRLWTIDMDPNNCNFVLDQELPNVDVLCQKGEEYLKNFPKHMSHISFLYLDNFDWDWHPEKTEDFVIEQQKRYADLGVRMNNLNSQAAHLQQMVYAMPAMAPNSIVVCDDTWYNKWWGHYSGKCGAVVPFLINNGYQVLYTCEDPEYGTILGRGIK